MQIREVGVGVEAFRILQHLHASETYGTCEEVKGFAVTEVDKVLVMGAYAKVTNWAFSGRVGVL